MPVSAAKKCRHLGCAELVRDGAGYCQAHKADANAGKWGDERRGSRHERGYGSEWEVTRKRILRRDKGLCQVCLKGSRYRPARAVDHIIPKAEGGSDEDENLQAICKTCHDAKTTEEAKRARQRG